MSIFFKIKNNDLLRNVGVLALGTLLSQVIPVLLQPVFRRLYTPEEYGIFSIYLSIVGIFIPIAALRYEQAIVPAESNKEASKLLFLSVIVSFLFSILIFTTIFFFNTEIAILLKIKTKYVVYLFFVPLGIFTGNFFIGLNLFSIRNKKFHLSSKGKVLRRIIESIVILVSGMLKVKPLGLFTGDVFGSLTGGFFLLKKLKLSFNSKDLNIVLKKYSSFPKKNVVPTLFNSFALLAPVLLVNEKFSTQDVGYFDLSRQILALPLALIATSVSQVFLEKTSSAYNSRKKVVKDFYQISLILLFLSVIGTSIIFFFGEKLFSILFGEMWEVSGKISTILVFSYAIKFIVSPLSASLISLRKLNTVALWQTFYFLLITFLFAIKFDNFTNFIYVYTIIDILMYLIYWFLILKNIKKYEQSIAI